MRPILLYGLIVLAVSTAGGRAGAEAWLPDAVSKAIAQAGVDLARGEARSVALARLRTSLSSAGESPYSAQGKSLADDLEASIQTEKSRDASAADPAVAPERFLMDSRWWPDMWSPEMGSRNHWAEQFRGIPNDPAASILRGERAVIDRLVPFLKDRSPTRGFADSGADEFPEVPRVCDLAASLIHFHGRVWFFGSSGTSLHARDPALRADVIAQVRAWWSEARDRSVADGIRLLLPKAAFYEKASMAENLIGLGRETKDIALKREGLQVLREMFEENQSPDAAAYLANVLQRHGGVGVVDVLYRRWLEMRSKPGYMFQGGIASFLARHGGRREWELLTDLARGGYAEPRDSQSRSQVGPAIVHSGVGLTSLWAVPALAMALSRTEISGSRSVAGANNQPFSLADDAVQQLQTVTGVEFGYRAAASREDRLAAITGAREWWAKEGRGKYTFDAIESMTAARATPTAK